MKKALIEREDTLALYHWRQKRIVTAKNRALARQIDESLKYREKYLSLVTEKRAEPADTADARVTDEQLFQYVNDVIVREQLFLDSKFSRQVRHYPERKRVEAYERRALRSLTY